MARQINDAGDSPEVCHFVCWLRAKLHRHLACQQYTVSQKNVRSLTGYNFNIHPPIFILFSMSSADIQKSATAR